MSLKNDNLIDSRLNIVDFVMGHRLEPRSLGLRSFKEGVAKPFATPSNSHSMPFPITHSTITAIFGYHFSMQFNHCFSKISTVSYP